ncbi:MAG: permease [Actinobacteria bacterium]|nr:permease [Actinomycetota bacterium]
MAQIAAPRALETRKALSSVLLSLGALAILLVLVDPSRVPAIQNFLLVFSSLLIEAIPFVLLGALVSAAIEVFVPREAFYALAKLPKPLQLPAAGLAGMAFPVCECGSVPVARRLAAKGLAPSAAVTFMLAAPILNPIVIASTFLAYRGRDLMWPMVLGRTGLGLLAAIAVGWAVGARPANALLKPRASDTEEEHSLGRGERWKHFFSHLSGDFIFMGKFLFIGAVLAAALQTFMPQTFIGAIAGTPVLDLFAMMLLAYLLSLCSESDAFVAASFVQFGLGAQLAFLVFGPMVDTKLTFLYGGTFTKGFLRTVILVVGAVTVAGALWIEVLFG